MAVGVQAVSDILVRNPLTEGAMEWEAPRQSVLGLCARTRRVVPCVVREDRCAETCRCHESAHPSERRLIRVVVRASPASISRSTGGPACRGSKFSNAQTETARRGDVAMTQVQERVASEMAS